MPHASKKVLLLTVAATLFVMGACNDSDPVVPEVEATEVSKIESLGSFLKSAATAEESFYVGEGSYTDDLDDLVAEGLQVPDAVDLDLSHVTDETYCLEATDGEMTMYIDSEESNSPVEGSC